MLGTIYTTRHGANQFFYQHFLAGSIKGTESVSQGTRDSKHHRLIISLFQATNNLSGSQMHVFLTIKQVYLVANRTNGVFIARWHRCPPTIKPL